MKRLFALGLALALLTVACSSDDNTGGSDSSESAAPEATELTVFAASSLTAAFEEAIGPDFEAANPGTTVTFNVGASSDLAGQIQSEGTADAFASASQDYMDDVEKDPGVSDRTDFVKNPLVIITPPDNPADISSIDDLATPGVQLVLGAKGVPIGDFAREALDNAGILAEASKNIVSNEEDNASVVAKIVAGEGDAAIVYTSDVSEAAGNDVTAVTIPSDVNVIATYPIAVVGNAPNADVAAAFVAYVTGTEGQATLKEYGFEPIA
jgi:molybdate transport system substrate-binding protein